MVSKKRSGSKDVPGTPDVSGGAGLHAREPNSAPPAPRVLPAVISSGSLNLDIALGIGGIPRNQITEIFGSESTGKTTLCQHILAEAQKLGGLCAFIDADHALDPKYAARCGIDVNQLYICEPETAEEALEIAETLTKSGCIAALAIDSLTALLLRSEMNGRMGDSSLHERNRLIAQALYRLNNICRQNDTALILTNQIRHSYRKLYHSEATSTANLALKLHASVRLELKAMRLLKIQGEAQGIHVHVRVVKNKLARSFRSTELDILYNEGIYKIGDILDMALQLNIITNQASVYTFQGLKLGESRANAMKYLNNFPLVSEALERRIRQYLLDPVHLEIEY